MSHYHAALIINGLRLQVLLGVHEQEQLVPQPVEVDLRFYFEQAPACSGDDASDHYICYDELCMTLVNYVKDQRFRLIEYLAHDLHRVIREYLESHSESRNTRVWIAVLKCEPPVSFDIKGTRYVYSDLPADATVVGVM